MAITRNVSNSNISSYEEENQLHDKHEHSTIITILEEGMQSKDCNKRASTLDAENPTKDTSNENKNSSGDMNSKRSFQRDYRATSVASTCTKDFNDSSSECSSEKKETPHGRTNREFIFVHIAGLCLAFSAGYSNGCCISGFLTDGGIQQSVAGFTGTYTASAFALAGGEFSQYGFKTCMILSVAAGSYLAGVLNPRNMPYELRPMFGPTFLIAAAFTLTASLVAKNHANDNALFFLTAAANGIQNGMTSMYSGNLIRTTHLTGTTTDIALYLGQMTRGNHTNRWKFDVLITLALSFWSGSLVAFYATQRFHEMSLLFNAVFFFCIAFGVWCYFSYTHHMGLLQAMLGTGDWDELLEEDEHEGLELSTRRGGKAKGDDLVKLFDEIDLNGDGEINQAELFHALANNRLQVTKRSMYAIMDVAEKENGEWSLSKEEWVLLVESTAGHDIPLVPHNEYGLTPNEMRSQALWLRKQNSEGNLKKVNSSGSLKWGTGSFHGMKR